VLEISVDEALEFFYEERNLVRAIQPLSDVGLGILSWVNHLTHYRAVKHNV